MATITTINATDLLSASRAVINTNFSNLNTAKVDGATALTTAGRLIEVASSGVATQTSFASSAVLLSTGSYADPAWLTSLATSKLSGTVADANLASTAVTPAAYGAAGSVATFTVDAKGRITAAASVAVAIAASQVTSGTLDNARTTAASTNTVSAIVARDASGNFAAGTITATFSGNLTGNVTGNASGTAATITGALALANTPLTTRGDLLVATTATPILGRLAKGTQYQVLTGGATDPTWGAVDLSQATAITGTLPLGNGGTGATTLAGAGIVVGSASLTTANAIPVVASAGTLGQSDVYLASGVFSRAGTLGLSATGANVVTFSTNGVERGRFDASGAFSSLVSVFGTLAALDAAVTGIAGTPTQASVTNNNTNTDVVRIANGNNTIGATTQAFKTRAASGSAATTIVQSGDTIGQFDFLGADGAAYRTAARFRVVVDGTPGLSDMPGRFSFFTTPDGSAAPEERLTIKSNGAVLIGTTTDDGSSKLQVAGKVYVKGGTGSDAVPDDEVIISTSTTGYRGLTIKSLMNAGGDFPALTLLHNNISGYGTRLSVERNAGSLVVDTLYNGAWTTGRLTVNAQYGNVLIGGTTNGNYRLDVQSSGSTGTGRFYDQTATIGVTSLVVRAGAGQSTTALQTWQNNAGATLASVSSGGIVSSVNTAANAGFSADSGTGASYYLSGLSVRHDGVIRWYLYKNNDSAGNFYISRYDDAGAHLGDPISINRSAGYVSIAESGSRVGFFGVTPAARAAALTAADATAINTGDAGSDTAISNMRTRIGELETKLQAYGLLN